MTSVTGRSGLEYESYFRPEEKFESIYIRVSSVKSNGSIELIICSSKWKKDSFLYVKLNFMIHFKNEKYKNKPEY